MRLLVGFSIVTSCLMACVVHLDQSITSYYDFVGMVMVLGGTLAVAFMTLPLGNTESWYLFSKYLFKSKTNSKHEIISKGIKFVSDARSYARFQAEEMPGIAGKVYKDGAELIGLGMKIESIESILEERIHQFRQNAMGISKGFKSLAKYPPAFGLAGTVLGLVHLMRGISEGMNPDETGVRMAIALVATFYGLLMANMFVSPIGEILGNAVESEVKEAEISLQAVLLAANKTEEIETVEMLQSYDSSYSKKRAKDYFEEAG